MKTTFSKTSKFIALAMMFLASFTVFTACGSDDDDESNIVKIDGQETKVVSMNAQEIGETANIFLTIQPIKEGQDLITLNFNFPIKDYGKKIACDAKNVKCSFLSDGLALSRESHYIVNKTEDGVYKIKFQLAQTVANKTTTMAGSYEGKSMPMTDPAAQ